MREEINQYLSKTKRQTIGVICVFLLIFGGAPLFQKLASPHREVIFRLEQICSSLEIWTINVNDSRRRFRGNPGKDINFDVFLKAKEETLDLQVLNGLADQIEDYIKSTEWDDAVRRFTQITQKDNRPYSMVRVRFYGTPHQRHILDGDSEREGVFYLDMKRVVTQETGEVSWVVGRREYPKVSVLFPPIAELTAFLLLTVLLVWDYWFHLSIYQSQDYHPRLYWHTRWQEEKSENRLICRRRKVLKYGFWLLMLLSLLIYDFRNPSDLTAPSQALLIWLVFAFWFRLWIRGDIPKIRYSQRMKRMILGLGLCFCLLTGMLRLVL
ncbi:hypothetical protein EII17_07630 [Clostridiales bacterium COT073_COT-073]|nr:hypothetical protein EII17_07630 [Clostridiales bacterium COT073_COT-073]